MPLLSFRPCLSLLLLVFLIGAAPAHSDTLSGKVVRILDGDTVEVLDAQKQTHRVRLAGIDAPESKQPFGTKAKQKLSGLVGGETVSVGWRKRDRYGRIVGKLMLDGADVNLALVQAGFAWWYREYQREQSLGDRRLYEAAEAQARAQRVGLWTDPKPIAPWDWRHQPAPVSAAALASECPCDSGRICTGPHGGTFCVRPSGSKKYFPRN